MYTVFTGPSLGHSKLAFYSPISDASTGREDPKWLSHSAVPRRPRKQPWNVLSESRWWFQTSHISLFCHPHFIHVHPIWGDDTMKPPARLTWMYLLRCLLFACYHLTIVQKVSHLVLAPAFNSRHFEAVEGHVCFTFLVPSVPYQGKYGVYFVAPQKPCKCSAWDNFYIIWQTSKSMKGITVKGMICGLF